MRSLLLVSLYIIIYIYNGILPLQAKVTAPTRRLVALLADMQKAQEVTPDSFYVYANHLRQTIRQEQDTVSRAVCSATLAHLYVLHSHLAQTNARDTESHIDSLQEWSRQEYLQHAAELYADALGNPESLYGEQVEKWIPLVEKTSLNKALSGDMLNMIWNAAVNDLPAAYRQKVRIPTYARLVSFYRSKGKCREALTLMLDSLDRNGIAAQDSTLLYRLKEEYASCDACAEVYLRLSQLPVLTPEEREEILHRGIKAYPGYWRKEALENALLQLAHPQLLWNGLYVYYPNKKVETVLRVRNLTSVRFSLYRLPVAFDQTQKDILRQVCRQGKRIHSFTHTLRKENPITEYSDTVCWQTPGYGRYALVMEAKTPARLCEKIEPQVSFFRVSSIGSFSVGFPNGVLRQVVVDALSGAPLQGVQARYLKEGKDTLHLLKQTLTDERGMTEFTVGQGPRHNILLHLSNGPDSALAPLPLQTMFFPQAGVQRLSNVRLFTDRSVYRPGQKVYVAALAYDSQGHRAAVRPSREITLLYYDANRQKIAEHTLLTDSFGVASDSITLSSSLLPGQFRISVRNGSSCTFRVEEYKRPTFYVEMEQPSQVVWPMDSIAVTGWVRTYSGVPLGNSRITGTYRWTNAFWRYWPGNDDTRFQQSDTVYTDKDGRFILSLPVSQSSDYFRWGRRLSVQVDALSPYGEVQGSSLSVPLCSAPLRLHLSLPRWQERGKLSSWCFKLLGPTDLPVQGMVDCLLRDKKGNVVFRTQVQAGTDTVPTGLKEVASGDYQLHAHVRIGADTASCTLPFTLFDLQDSRVPVDTVLWVYCPDDTFALSRPARIQLGSSLDTAYVYCTLVSQDGVGLDTLMCLKDEARLLVLPYKEEYADGASLQVSLYHQGRFYRESLRLYRELPSRRLQVRWHTFRNHLQPGQKEEWRLTLLHPDGTPVQANLMCALYDAALDAIYPHRMALSLYQGHRIPSVSVGDWSHYPHSYDFPFCLKLNDVPALSVPTWNPSYFNVPFGKPSLHAGMEYMSVATTAVRATGKLMNRSMAAKAMPEEEVAQDAMADAAPAMTDVTESRPSSEVRTNHSELAFFRSDLRTDQQGHVSIAFTLPQGLTRWHLLGLAHTKDMFTAQLNDTVVARKDFMAQVHLPRYLREGDHAVLTATLRNLTETEQKGEAMLQICDARTEKVLHTLRVPFSLEARADSVCLLPFSVPQGHSLLLVRWQAKTPQASDGEQHPLPVLSDVQAITEAKSFSLDRPQKWQMDLNKLFAYDHPAASNRTLTVEYTARPEWLALQSLPSLVNTKATDVLSLSSAFYATAMARGISRRVPDLRDAVAEWNAGADTLSATLGANAALTDLLMQEMPWVMDDRREAQRRAQLASLLTDASSPSHLMLLLQKLEAAQRPDGSFAWYPGMAGNIHLTTEVLRQLSRLQHLADGNEVSQVNRLRGEVLLRGLRYLHRTLSRQSERTPLPVGTLLPFMEIVSRSDVSLPKEMEADVRKWVEQLRAQAETLQREKRALAAVVLCRSGHQAAASKLMPELRRVIAQSDGFYLAYPGGTSYQPDTKIQHHVQVMEAFAEVLPSDTVAMRGLQQWLLRQKRTQDWGQPVQTADAVYALLLHSEGQLSDASADKVTLTDKAGRHLLHCPETRLGYLRQHMDANRPRTLQVDKRTPGISWGAAYAQYLMPIDKIEAQREGLTVRRDVDRLSTRVGDRLHVRYTLTIDHDLEYVVLSAPRIAAAEPAEPLSGYMCWGNLSGYRAIHDARTDYFFDSLPKGTYVIEEDWLMTHSGTYQTGAATLRCVYAPEFQSHTPGTTVVVQ